LIYFHAPSVTPLTGQNNRRFAYISYLVRSPIISPCVRNKIMGKWSL
jgi:hypothetical protein